MIGPGNGKGIFSRSIHRGRHQAKVSEDLAKKMNHIYEQGELEGWNQKQYRKALFNVVSEERKKLMTGKRRLNKNARIWSEL